jgi:hypothetical protein
MRLFGTSSSSCFCKARSKRSGEQARQRCGVRPLADLPKRPIPGREQLQEGRNALKLRKCMPREQADARSWHQEAPGIAEA